MSIESGLRDYLLANADVEALIGNQVYPEEAPDGAEEPYVVYSLFEVDEPRFLNGTRRYSKTTYEVQCADIDYNAALTLAAAVKKAIGGTQGNSVTTTLGGVLVIMFWAEQPLRRKHVTAQDRTRNQVVFDLVILER